MSERLFSPQPVSSGCVLLDGPEAHHLLHVMRASVGDEVTLFDGLGAEFRATVETLRRADAELRVVQRVEVDRELPFTMTFGVALPKGDRQKWLVEKLTELGATTLVPLLTDRAVAQPAAGAMDRLRRAVIEAAKQCGRNRLMEIAEPQTWASWIANSGSGLRLIAHPSGGPLGELDRAPAGDVLVSIGPEGGFTDAEVAAAVEAGWQSVSLGQRILRVETAAAAIAATIVLR